MTSYRRSIKWLGNNDDIQRICSVFLLNGSNNRWGFHFNWNGYDAVCDYNNGDEDGGFGYSVWTPGPPDSRTWNITSWKVNCICSPKQAFDTAAAVDVNNIYSRNCETWVCSLASCIMMSFLV